MLTALIGGSAFRRVSDGQMPEFVKSSSRIHQPHYNT